MPVPAATLSHSRSRIAGPMAVLAAGLLAGACSSADSSVSSLDSFLGPAQQTASVTSAGGSDNAVGSIKPAASRTELDKAIEYWAEQYKKQPSDLKSALAYAKNLKAAGRKQEAYAVLQDAFIVNGDSKELAGEMGRLALEHEQIAVAEKLLAMADDPGKPDWRLISARGTLLAKQSNYTEAIPFFERALALAPNTASLQNNLAMAHAANGNPTKAEEILRKAAASGNDPKIKQNLALVLGLQGKHEEANIIRGAGAGAETASADTEYVRRMVKATPVVATAAGVPAVDAVAAVSAKSTKAVAKGPATAAVKPVGDVSAMRPAGGTTEVSGTMGAWSTTVARAQ